MKPIVTIPGGYYQPGTVCRHGEPHPIAACFEHNGQPVGVKCYHTITGTWPAGYKKLFDNAMPAMYPDWKQQVAFDCRPLAQTIGLLYQIAKTEFIVEMLEVVMNGDYPDPADTQKIARIAKLYGRTNITDYKPLLKALTNARDMAYRLRWLRESVVSGPNKTKVKSLIVDYKERGLTHRQEKLVFALEVQYH